MQSDPRIDAYIERAQPFAQPILREIRARLHAAVPGLGETIKWGMPFFEHGGRPFANMSAFKAHAAFGFWQRGATRTGQEGEAMGQYGRLTSVADLPALPELKELAARALAAADDPAAKPARAPKPEADVPPALAAALANDTAASAAFAGFPPGARREYCDWIGEAKRDETRDKRVAEAIGWIRNGKRRNWKYENC